MTDEEDDISITSTVPSEPAYEYNVDDVLAERSSENGIEYLVRWEGYLVDRSTWEPEESFNDPKTLLDWQKKKRLIEAGKRHPFDVASFERHQAKLESDSLNRKRRRAAKRRRLGLEQPDMLQLETSIASSPESEPENEPERVPVAPPRPPPQTVAHRPTVPFTGRVRSITDKPPMVGFGRPQGAPGHPRPAKPTEQEPTERFRLLSTQHKHNKARTKEPAPDINQLDLRRPSEWLPRNASTTNLGQHPISSLAATEPIPAPTKSTDLPAVHRSTINVRANAVGQHSPKPSDNVGDAIPPQKPQSPTIRRNLSNEATESSGLAIRGLASHALAAKDDDSRRQEGRTNEPIRLPSRRPKKNSYQLSKGRFINPGEILVHLLYGSNKAYIGATRFCGLPQNAKQMILKTKTTYRFEPWFEHICTLEQYRMLSKNAPLNEIYCNGWIEGFDDTEPLVHAIGENLREEGRMAICYLGDDSQVLLAYSPESPVSDLFGDCGCDGTTFLAITLRSALPPVRELNRPTRQAIASSPVAASPPVSRSVAPPSVDIHAMFKDQFGITFQELATVQGSMGPQVVQIFYLMFPLDDEKIEEEYQVVTEFLKRCGDDIVIYSNRQQDDWKKFIKSRNDGVVLFHQTFVDYYTLPELFKGLRRSSFNFWNVSLRQPLEFADRPLHFQRIFPHGGAILLTEDFMIHDPECACIILAWFNDYVRKRFPGSWKLMLPPDALNWLIKRHDLAFDKDKAKAGYWLAMYHFVMLANTYRSDIEIWDDMNCVNLEFNSPPVISPTRLPGSGFRKEDDHPDIPKGPIQTLCNTDHLIEFFAGWCLVTSHKFRRFLVLTSTEEQPRWRSWHHLEIHYKAEEFMKNFQIQDNYYRAKINPHSKPPSHSSSVSDPAPKPKTQQQSPSTYTPNSPNPEPDIPWRGLSQVRPRDSCPPSDSQRSPQDPRSRSDSRPSMHHRRPSPRDSSQDSRARWDSRLFVDSRRPSPRDSLREPYSRRDSYPPRDSRRSSPRDSSRESYSRRDSRSLRNSPRGSPRVSPGEPYSRRDSHPPGPRRPPPRSYFRGDFYYPAPYR